MVRSSSDCLLVAEAGGDPIGYVWPQDLGAQMRQTAHGEAASTSPMASRA